MMAAQAVASVPLDFFYYKSRNSITVDFLPITVYSF